MDIRKSRVILDPSEVPFDITFVIEDCGSKVRAHKWIMAMGSPVCMKQFYGELRETSDEILIKKTTKSAFVTMVDTFYGKDIMWMSKSAEEIFRIADIAEKYQVDVLKEDVEEALREFPLNKENVVIVASIAESYGELFEAPANTLLQSCAIFLTSVLLVKEDFVNFAVKYSKTSYADVALRLLALMDEVPPPLIQCCGLKTCRRGKPMMSFRDFKVGDTVQINPGGKERNVTPKQLREGDKGVVREIFSNVILLEGGDWSSQGYFITRSGYATFLFCKC